MYLAVALPMLALLLVSGKTFIYGGDALYQQYPTLVYTARAVRRLFSGGGFRMVDFSLGQGMDSLNMLAYYGLTDPLQWLAALVPESGLEVYYQALIFLYIYLSGLFFGNNRPSAFLQNLYFVLQRLQKDERRGFPVAHPVFVFCAHFLRDPLVNFLYAAPLKGRTGNTGHGQPDTFKEIMQGDGIQTTNGKMNILPMLPRPAVKGFRHLLRVGYFPLVIPLLHSLEPLHVCK